MEILSSEPTNVPSTLSKDELIERLTDALIKEKLYIETITELKEDIKELEKEIEEFNDYDLKDYLPEIEDVPLDDIESFDFKFKRPGDLIAKGGNLVFVPKDMVFTEYTKEEYAEEEQKMRECFILQIQQANFENLIKGEREQKEFYREQVKYYQKLADRTLAMQEKLIEIIDTQTKDMFTRSLVDAKKTDWKK